MIIPLASSTSDFIAPAEDFLSRLGNFFFSFLVLGIAVYLIMLLTVVVVVCVVWFERLEG